LDDLHRLFVGQVLVLLMEVFDFVVLDAGFWQQSSVLISPDVQTPSVTVLHPASDDVTCGRRDRNGSDQNSYIDRD
jgi:hypothetical protein